MPPTWLELLSPEAVEACQQGAPFDNAADSPGRQLAGDYVTVLPQTGVLSVEGPDAAIFLQGQLSCDLQRLSEELSCRGIHATPKGRAIASFRLQQVDPQRMLISLPTSTLPLLQQSLTRYIVFSKAELSDASDQWAPIALGGTAADTVIAQIFPSVPTEPNQQVNTDSAHCVRLEGATSHYLVMVAPGRLVEFWQATTAVLTPAHSAVSRLQEIRSGVATIEASTSEGFIPQMLNYDTLGAISFNKGCYTGQEVIARAHYRGAVKRRMQGFQCATSICPEPGAEIFRAGESCGQVVNAVQSEDELVEGLAVLPLDFDGPASLSREDGTAPLKLSALAYAQ